MNAVMTTLLRLSPGFHDHEVPDVI